MIDHLTLLSKLKVKKIYWVDDENARQEDLDIVKLAEALAKKIAENDSTHHLKECLDSLTAALSGQAEKPAARTAVRDMRAALEFREELDPTDKILEALNRLLANFPNDKDPKALIQTMLSKLPQPFSLAEKQALASAFEGRGEWEWRPISFTQWAAEHKEILADHNDSENTALLIVDLQNDRESSATTGEDVLSQWASWVTKNDSIRSVFAIAFTSLWKPEDEIKAGRTFTKQFFPGEPKKNQLPVLVLSKTRLQSDVTAAEKANAAAHEAFKKALGRLRACALHWDLAEDVQKLFTDSVAEAFKTLQELSIEELLMAVSGKHTHQEGASDVDTLVRMAAVAQRAALLNRIAQNEEVANTLVELRGLSEVVTEFNRKLLEDTSGIERLRASEMHDPGQVVNALLSPLATGDIFEVTCNGQTEYQVLVSNICDLTLRGHTGKRKIEDGLLLKLREQDKDDKKMDEEDKAFKALPSFPQESPLAGKQWVASYNLVSIVPLEVLDLCWTNKGGYCQWEAADVTTRLAPSQGLRLAQMLKSFNQQIGRERIASRLPGVDIQYQLSEDPAPLSGVKFAVRRVGRMAHTFAHAVSEGFGRNVARHSFEHDISGGN